MSTHAYELPGGEPVPGRLVDEAGGGEVIYLTRSGQRVAAVVGAEVAELAAELVRRRHGELPDEPDELEEALEERWAQRVVAEARTQRAAGVTPVPHDQVMAEFAEDLVDYPADDSELAEPFTR